MVLKFAVNDMSIIRVEDVEKIVRNLCVTYHWIRRSFKNNEAKINHLCDNGSISAAIQLMTKVFGLPDGFVRRVGYSANINSPAMLSTEIDMLTNRPIACTVLLQSSKTDLQKMCRYLVLHMLAHELAHARMRLDRYYMQKSEFATDVLAVLVTGSSKGYSEAMIDEAVQWGYIRRELLPEVFRCLALYAERIYLR